MKAVEIQDVKPGLIQGVEVHVMTGEDAYKEAYFEWTATPLVTKFQTLEISGGLLQAWHHVPLFTEIETHVDAEMFYFVSGTAIMLFMDVAEGNPDMESAKIVRIKPNTQIIIPAGKGHFIAVAEDSEPVTAIVVSPKMDAPRISLPIPVKGVI